MTATWLRTLKVGMAAALGTLLAALAPVGANPLPQPEQTGD